MVREVRFIELFLSVLALTFVKDVQGTGALSFPFVLHIRCHDVLGVAAEFLENSPSNIHGQDIHQPPPLFLTEDEILEFDPDLFLVL